MGTDDQGNKILTITQDEIDAIADAMIAKMRGPDWIPSDQHKADHEWAKNRRESDEKFDASKRKVFEQVIGGLTIAGLLAFVGWIGHTVIETLQRILSSGAGG